MYVPFVWLMWGTTAGMFEILPYLPGVYFTCLISEGLLLTRVAGIFYATGRKICGHNTWYGKG